MATLTRNWILAGLLGLLVACGGGGGGDRAQGVEPGPPPPGQVPPPDPIPPTPAPAPYAEQEVLVAHITSVSIDGDGIATVDFQLTNGEGTAITDLAYNNVRFTIAKLQNSALGSTTGTWQSYLNSVRSPDPCCGDGTEARLQATYERPAEEDALINNGDGTYRYTLTQSITALPEDELAQAETEGLDLSYDDSLTHRVAMQFDGNDNTTVNPFYDWIPATGSTSVFNMNIADTANCNRCHDVLGIHGGNRREVEYCVTCHNPGSTDPESTNTVDMKVMIHKIHSGRNLPSVQEGGEYIIWGYRNSEHNYSHLGYPQDIRNCVNCHVGSATVGDRTDLVITAHGDNWAEVPSKASCGSCHDTPSTGAGHINGQKEEDCATCHSEPGFAGSIANSHRMLVRETSEQFVAKIESVTNSGPGESPMVTFSIKNPMTDEFYDILNDPVFNSSATRLAVGLGWSTTDYTNTGTWSEEGDAPANQVQVNPLSDATDNGDGTFTVTFPPIPGEVSGSGIAAIEGHPGVDIGEVDEEGNPVDSQIPLTNAHDFFSVDEPDGNPVIRRDALDGEVVELDKCLTCHESLSLHGDNRTDNIDACVSCHNPRNTDRHRRELDLPWCDAPPTDGPNGTAKKEESVDFKTLIHAIHAAGMRENALQVVGFNCFTTHVYDEEHVHYPGALSNCTACHSDEGYQLPLSAGVLGTTVDTGADIADPSDDIVVTPTAAACSSCHDSAVSKAHMETVGGANFATTQEAIDNGEVVESCSVCHGAGHAFDVSEVHTPTDE